MQRAIFFDHVRGRLFGGAISKSQFEGIDGILDKAVAVGTPVRHLAYMLATAFHETARTMQPIIETRNANDKRNPSVDVCIRRLEASFSAGKLPWVKTPYWRKDAAGKSWLGRGLVQLTHKRNYVEMSSVTGVDLVADPDRAMEPGIAVTIMFEGMARGSFTGRPLSDYLDGFTPDYKNARRVINGLESAERVVGHALKFEQALLASGYAVWGDPKNAGKPQPLDVEADGGQASDVALPPAPVPQINVDPEKLDKPLLHSKTVWQWILTGIGAPIAAFGGFDWRVQLAIVLLIAASGGYAIKRRNDLAKVVRDIKAEIYGD